jgi:hypothetical protein
MMVNSKEKGSRFEHDAADALNKKIKYGKFNRIYASGSVGTVLNVPGLMGDISGEIRGLPKHIKMECKIGYSNIKDKESKSISLRKEWFDKIAEEANADYSYPMMIGKFDRVTKGTKYFVSMDVEVFAELMNLISNLQKELDLIYENKTMEGSG